MYLGVAPSSKDVLFVLLPIIEFVRSFQISYFSTDLLVSLSYYSFNLSVLMRMVQ